MRTSSISSFDKGMFDSDVQAGCHVPPEKHARTSPRSGKSKAVSPLVRRDIVSYFAI